MLKLAPYIAAFLFIALCFGALSYQHHEINLERANAEQAEKKKADPEKQNEKPSKAKQGTTENPIVVSVLTGLNEQTESKGAKEYEGHYSAEWNLVYITIFLTAFTLGLMIYTALLWGAGEVNAKRQLRAYLSVTAANISNIETAGEITATIIFKNCGQTPARGVHKISGLMWTNFPLVDDLDSEVTKQINNPLFPKSKEIIGPGCETHDIIISPRGLTATEIAAVKAGTHAVYIYGEHRYFDIFDKPHFTKFKYFTGGSVGVRNRKLIAYKEGNEAD